MVVKSYWKLALDSGEGAWETARLSKKEAGTKITQSQCSKVKKYQYEVLIALTTGMGTI